MINQTAGSFLLRALVVASAIVAAGCDLSTGDMSGNINQFEQVRNPKGTVIGLVVDSNNRPLKGAKVSIAGRTTTTDANGTYKLEVQVTNAAGASEDTAHENNFIISVAPPAVTNSQPTAHLGALIRVYPEAQFNNTNHDSNLGGDQAANQSIFIDGFWIQAEPAVLPELTSTVRILSIRDDDTGQAVAGASVSLDFVSTAETDPSDENIENDGSDINYPTASWTGTTDANGAVTFTNVAANSHLQLHINGYSCDGNDDNSSSDDTCEIDTENETNTVTYENYFVTLLEDDGDTVNPFFEMVAGVYDDTTDATGFPEDTECGAAVNIGKLLRNVDGTAANGGFRFVANEPLQTAGVSSSSAVVYDATNQAYVTVADVDVSGNTVTVTTASALTNGAEFSVYFFVPDFLDLAGNALVESGDLDIDCFGSITPALGSGTTWVAVDLEAFAAPVTNPGAVTAVQEALDPRLSGTLNDAPANQAQSVSFNDIRDEDDGNDVIWGMNATAAPNDLNDIQFALQQRYNAYGNISVVQEFGPVFQDNARIEFAPVTGAPGYRIDINGFDAEDVDAATFADDEFVDTFVNTIDGNDVRVGYVDRGGTIFFVVIVEDAEEGDVVNIAALDDLGHAGAVSSVTIVDNVQPTVTVQRSYNDLITYNDFNAQNVDSDDSGDNASGCFSHNSNHAGVSLASGTSRFGEGGELSDPGSVAAAGNLCIGSGPEMLVNVDGDNDSAHTDLEGGRDADFDAVANNVTNYPRAYDSTAFTAWARPTVKMGAAVTENLASTGTPAETVSATLSGFAVQNDTVDGHLSGPMILDLITFDVNDVYVLANTDHGQTITFTGMTDLAGNAATAAANAVLTVRDQWPPYLITGSSRASNGTITLVFDTPVRVDDGDTINITGTTVILDRDGDSDGNPQTVSFTQSTDNMTLTLNVAQGSDQALDLTTAFPAGGDLSYDDDAVAGTADDDHGVVDFRNIRDRRGNDWDSHSGEIDVPLFLMVDALPTMTVTQNTNFATTTSATFTFTVTANQPMANWVDNSGEATFDVGDLTNSGAAAFFDQAGVMSNCALSGSDLECTEAASTFLSTYLVLGANTGCTSFASGTARFNAAHTTLTITATCNATPATGDTVQLVPDAFNAESEVDGGEGATYTNTMITK